LALAVVSAGAAVAMAQTGPSQPQANIAAPVPGGGNVAASGVQTQTTFGVQGQTTVAATVQTGGVLHGDIGIKFGQHFDCRHVIDMLIRKQHLARFGGHVQPAPVAFGGFYGGPVFVQPKLGDLELGAVAMVADATPDSAPIYSVTICNKSDYDVGCFHVSAVAVLGEIHEFSPITTIKVPKLCAGEAVCVELQIPYAAMAMGHGNVRCAFDKLVVAIDAFDQYIECDEMNNIAVLQRDAVVIVETTTTTTTTEAVVEATVEQPSATQIPPSVEENTVAPSAPAPDQSEASPLDNFDIDKLDLSPADASASLLSGRVFD
jgi:hypothetical protein